MQHITPSWQNTHQALFGSTRTREIEQAALSTLPTHTLMQRAASAVFKLGMALYPHARHVWVACGPGNNGGDGLLAAAYWQAQSQHTGTQVTVTWVGNEAKLPSDARYALAQARQAGVNFAETPPPDADLYVDALLGLGVNCPTQGQLGILANRLQETTAPVLCVDLPSGLNPDSGEWFNQCPTLPRGPRHTLALLTLKPGLFTAAGKETAGDLWWDDLGVASGDVQPDARLYGDTYINTPRQQRHNSHKGSHGDLLVFGGQDIGLNGQGMTGAALLAARAGLRSGAGRVYLGLLGSESSPSMTVDVIWPELMFRTPSDLMQSTMLKTASCVCGCGGGTAVRSVLPELLEHSGQLVLDADALNAIAGDAQWQQSLRQRSTRGQFTVLTPHPLEAARLLNTSASRVQSNRLQSATQLAEIFQCIVVLKGSGSVVAAPGETPVIHHTGNALLATAGTGDVLAGMTGAFLGNSRLYNETAFETTCHAVHQHGLIADEWSKNGFSASDLVNTLTPR